MINRIRDVFDAPERLHQIWHVGFQIVCLSFRSFVSLFVRSFAHLLAHSFAPLLPCSFANSFTHLFFHSFSAYLLTKNASKNSRPHNKEAKLELDLKDSDSSCDNSHFSCHPKTPES